MRKGSNLIDVATFEDLMSTMLSQWQMMAKHAVINQNHPLMTTV